MVEIARLIGSLMGLQEAFPLLKGVEAKEPMALREIVGAGRVRPAHTGGDTSRLAPRALRSPRTLCALDPGLGLLRCGLSGTPPLDAPASDARGPDKAVDVRVVWQASHTRRLSYPGMSDNCCPVRGV